MKKTIMILLLSALILLPLLAQEDVHIYNIPPGWKFKRFHSRELFRALYLLPDLPDEQLVRGDVPGRLLVFDKQDNLISDLNLEPWWWLKTFIGDKILLEQADEDGTYFIELVDLNGKEIYSLNTHDRWVAKALIGNDLVLEPSKERQQIGPISIIDGETGQEKFRLEPFQGPNGPSMPDCFLLIGDGFYVIGKGASLFLKSYYEPNKTFWQIWNIGGNIKDAMFLNKDLIAIGYGFDDFKKDIFMSGAAVIEWRTGEVLFNKNAIRRRLKDDKWHEDKWFNSLNYLNLSIEEDGGLIIGDEMLSPKSGGKKGWDETKPKKIKLRTTPEEIFSAVGKKGRLEYDRRYLVIDFGTQVRVEKRRYVVVDSENH